MNTNYSVVMMIPYILVVSLVKQQTTKINRTKVKSIGENFVSFSVQLYYVLENEENSGCFGLKTS